MDKLLFVVDDDISQEELEMAIKRTMKPQSKSEESRSENVLKRGVIKNGVLKSIQGNHSKEMKDEPFPLDPDKPCASNSDDLKNILKCSIKKELGEDKTDEKKPAVAGKRKQSRVYTIESLLIFFPPAFDFQRRVFISMIFFPM